MMIQAVALLHFIVTLYLTGLIWTVQRVHYPSFLYVEKQAFPSFAQFHQNRITWIVGPVMVMELVCNLWLWLANMADGWAGLLLFLVILIWIFTFFVSVPLHQQLLHQGYQRSVILKLIRSNWPRTGLWTLKSLLLIVIGSPYVPFL